MVQAPEGGAGSSSRSTEQRIRVFVSSTQGELAAERSAARAAIERLHLAPVLTDGVSGRQDVEQSNIFLGIYWQEAGNVGPGVETPPLLEEFDLAHQLGKPMLLYVKSPAPDRDARLAALLDRVRNEGRVAYRSFKTVDELRDLVQEDIAAVMTERFEAAGAERTAEATSAASASTAPAAPSLPIMPTPLIGREREVSEVGALLLRPEVRLLTLHGGAGVGKTRLAVAVAERVAAHFRGATWFVRLTSVSDPALVSTAIAQTMGLRIEVGDPLDAIIAHVGSQHSLLVLDNFEQVVAAAPVTVQLLGACPGLTILVTTREVLSVSGEHEYRVQPLALPPIDRRLDLDELGRVEAIALFVSRARAVNPLFQLTAENAPTVVRICRRLDGIPLAIELAAARSRAFTPEAILARLEQRLTLLGGGPRDLPEHQRTMRATIAWSYGLLAVPEQILLSRLSVLAGTWTLEDAEAICGGDELVDVIDGVSSLVEKGLLQMNADAPYGPRYNLYQSVRDFAAELLDLAGDTPRFAEAHFEHYQRMALESEIGVPGGDQDARTTMQLQWEHENIRVALRWGLDHQRYDDTGHMCWAIWIFWWTRGHMREARQWLGELLNHRQALSRDVLGRVLTLAGATAYLNAEWEPGWAYATEGLEITTEQNDWGAQAYALLALGLLALPRGELEQGRHYMEQGRDLFRRFGFGWGEVLSYVALGRLLVAARAEDRRLVLEEGLAFARKHGALLGIAGMCDTLAWDLLVDGDDAGAARYADEALRLYMELRQGEGATRSMETLGVVASHLGDPVTAVHLMAAAATYRETMGSPTWTADRPEYDAILADLRRTLGDDAFEARWREGTRLSVPEGFSRARAVVPTVAATTAAGSDG